MDKKCKVCGKVSREDFCQDCLAEIRKRPCPLCGAMGTEPDGWGCTNPQCPH